MTRPSARLRLLSAPVVAALALAAAGGCLASPQGGGEPLSRAAFLEQGNAICTKGNADIMAAAQASGAGWPPSGEAGEALFKTVLTLIEQQIDGIDDLTPPADMQPAIDGAVADARVVLTEVEAAGSTEFFMSEEDPWAAVNAKMKDLGLTACAEEPTE